MPIAAKPERPLAEVIQRNADLLGMSYGDYMVFLAANALEMPEHAPQPTKTLDTLEGMTPEGLTVGEGMPFVGGTVPPVSKAEELRNKIAS